MGSTTNGVVAETKGGMRAHWTRLDLACALRADHAARPGARGMPFALTSNGVSSLPVESGRDAQAMMFRCSVVSGQRWIELTLPATTPAMTVIALRTRSHDAYYELPLTGPAFGAGWVPVEQEVVSHRCLAGPAQLRLPHGTTTLEVSVVLTPDHPAEAMASA